MGLQRVCRPFTDSSEVTDLGLNCNQVELKQKEPHLESTPLSLAGHLDDPIEVAGLVLLVFQL